MTQMLVSAAFSLFSPQGVQCLLHLIVEFLRLFVGAFFDQIIAEKRTQDGDCQYEQQALNWFAIHDGKDAKHQRQTGQGNIDISGRKRDCHGHNGDKQADDAAEHVTVFRNPRCEKPAVRRSGKFGLAG